MVLAAGDHDADLGSYPFLMWTDYKHCKPTDPEAETSGKYRLSGYYSYGNEASAAGWQQLGYRRHVTKI